MPRYVALNDPSALRSQALHDLYDTLDLDPSVQGYLDWVTGIMQVNCGIDEYKAALAGGSVPATLAVALDHESHHAVQFALLGYLYRFACTLRILIENSLEAFEQAPQRNYGTLFNTVSKQIAHAAIYRNVIKDLRRAPEGTISVLDLVEGVTYWAQTCGNVGYDGDAYIDLLKRSHLPDEYSRAYRYFESHVGSKCSAASTFPIAAHLSLCSHSPPECFKMFTEAFRSGRLSQGTFLEELVEYCRAHDPDYRGFSWEFLDGFGQSFPQHPVFGGIRDFFLTDRNGKELFAAYLFKPDTLKVETRLGLMDLVLLRPDPDPTAPGFRNWHMLALKRTDNPHAYAARMLMAAVSRRLMGTVSVPLE